MYPVRKHRQIAADVFWLSVHAPLVARCCRAGQFVIVRAGESGERIPLTIADADPEAGTIELIVKVVGRTTALICATAEGQALSDVVGPLGRPTEIENVGHALVVGGGVGTAVIYPLARALRVAGNRVTALIGGRSREFVLLEAELSRVADAVLPCTDDGSHGFRGTVADLLAALLGRDADSIGIVFAAGPVPMMRAIAERTRPWGIRTIASLNPIMVDGTGMCGGCRVTVGGHTRFACVDGPEFDAHAVDFDELADRLTTYRVEEAQAREAIHGAAKAAAP